MFRRINYVILHTQHLSLTKTHMSRQDLGAGDMDWMRGKVLLKPEDQLQLTEAVMLAFLQVLIYYYVNFILEIIILGITRRGC